MELAISPGLSRLLKRFLVQDVHKEHSCKPLEIIQVEASWLEQVESSINKPVKEKVRFNSIGRSDYLESPETVPFIPKESSLIELIPMKCTKIDYFSEFDFVFQPTRLYNRPKIKALEEPLISPFVKRKEQILSDGLELFQLQTLKNPEYLRDCQNALFSEILDDADQEIQDHSSGGLESPIRFDTKYHSIETGAIRLNLKELTVSIVTDEFASIFTRKIEKEILELEPTDYKQHLNSDIC